MTDNPSAHGRVPVACPVCGSIDQSHEPDPTIFLESWKVRLRCQGCGIRWDGRNLHG